MHLEIQKVSKRYKGDVWGLRDFTLDLRPGILGLLGPNGAGKSTLMRILATITKPTDGMVLWNNTETTRDPDAFRQVPGHQPRDFGVYPNLTAIEFLEYIAAIKGLSAHDASRRIDELLQLVNLGDARNRPVGGYSGGMRQRVGIAQALLNDPKLLIVDEPTAGLDPEERVRFRNLLSELSGERIVILSTHIVSDVEATATQIALINRGHLVTCGTPEAISQMIAGRVWEWLIPSDKLAEFKQRFLISGTIRKANGVLIRVVSNERPSADASPASPTLADAHSYAVAADRQEQSLRGGGTPSPRVVVGT